jgi:integrase
MKGHIRQRGKKSWELKFDAGRDPITSERNIQYHSFRGTKREAQNKLSELLAAVGNSEYVEPNKITVAEHVRARIAQWQISGRKSKDPISAATAESYLTLLRNQISLIGDKPVQKLETRDIEEWHSAMTASGISRRTMLHAHQVLSKALDDAVRHKLAAKNAAAIEGAPSPESEEVEILTAEQANHVLDALTGDVRTPAIVSLFTGLRVGEVLALRWSNVEFDAREIRVREALEETKQHGIRFKAPKTRAGRRDISLPDIVLTTLRDYRRQQLEQRLALGLGKLPDDALLFPDLLTGVAQSPRNFGKRWHTAAKRIGLGHIRFHALRHTHASQLIDAGIDVVKISKRLGHASPNITLQVYAHLFRRREDKAADAINAVINAALAGGK